VIYENWRDGEKGHHVREIYMISLSKKARGDKKKEGWTQTPRMQNEYFVLRQVVKTEGVYKHAMRKGPGQAGLGMKR
jgi:hypothetical protein